VLEIGAGCGAVTAALLKYGIPLRRLYAVERSVELAAHLEKKFPGMHVIHGDATQLQSLLMQQIGTANPTLSAIVSSLPFRSLPREVGESIVEQIHTLMSPRTKLIQFTYDLRPKLFAPFERFDRVHSQIIWLNLPPARVDVFQRR
jgi:phospholipid N-methyltransferase